MAPDGQRPYLFALCVTRGRVPLSNPGFKYWFPRVSLCLGWRGFSKIAWATGPTGTTLATRDEDTRTAFDGIMPEHRSRSVCKLEWLGATAGDWALLRICQSISGRNRQSFGQGSLKTEPTASCYVWLQRRAVLVATQALPTLYSVHVVNIPVSKLV